MNIIVVNPFGIGDVLFSTPMISRIKEKFPDCKFVANPDRYNGAKELEKMGAEIIIMDDGFFIGILCSTLFMIGLFFGCIIYDSKYKQYDVDGIQCNDGKIEILVENKKSNTSKFFPLDLECE